MKRVNHTIVQRGYLARQPRKARRLSTVSTISIKPFDKPGNVGLSISSLINPFDDFYGDKLFEYFTTKNRQENPTTISSMLRFFKDKAAAAANAVKDKASEVANAVVDAVAGVPGADPNPEEVTVVINDGLDLLPALKEAERKDREIPQDDIAGQLEDASPKVQTAVGALLKQASKPRSQNRPKLFHAPKNLRQWIRERK